MSDLDRNYTSPFGRAAGRADAATVDAGLRSYMLRIYNYMSIGLAITGLAALGVYMVAVADPSSADAVRLGKLYLTPVGYAIYVSPLKWLFMLAPLAMVFAISAGINRFKPATTQLLFWAFSALMGVSLSSIFLVYTHTSIVRVFFITAATFGALIFAGLTAYDTQRLKNDYIYGYASQGGDIAERAAITGALSLYLNFINLFTLLLQLLGQRD